MGDRRQHSWPGYVERWTSRVTPSSRCLGTHRLPVRLQAFCSAAWRVSRASRRSSASMQQVTSSRCSLRCGRLRLATLVEAAGPSGAAGLSARRLLDALRPGLVTQRLEPAELWDIDTRDQLLAWRLQSSAAVSSILDLVAERAKTTDRPVVIAIDGPSCSGKSILATAVALRSGAAVLEGDDFYRDTLPRLSAAQREAMSDAAVVDAVIDWERLRDEGLLPLRAGHHATFQPYDWDANDGRLAPAKTVPAAKLIIVEGVYAARPELADLIDFAVYLGIDPDVRARRYAQREDEPDWRGFWERGEIYYFSDVRPPASFDLQLDAEALT